MVYGGSTSVTQDKPYPSPSRRSRLVVLGLGSNLDDRWALLRDAVRRIAEIPGVALEAIAPVYETAPLGPPQGHYLNTAVRVETSLDLRRLLDATLTIEGALGRVRPDPVRWGPRRIDIDLLWAEHEIVSQEGLFVPHPGLPDRPFALRPLLDLVPLALDPRTGRPYAEAAAADAARRLERIGLLGQQGDMGTGPRGGPGAPTSLE